MYMLAMEMWGLRRQMLVRGRGGRKRGARDEEGGGIVALERMRMRMRVRLIESMKQR